MSDTVATPADSNPYKEPLIHLMLRPSRKRALRLAEAILAAISPTLRARARAARASGLSEITVSICDPTFQEGLGYEAEFGRALSKLVGNYPKSFKKLEVKLDYSDNPHSADAAVIMDYSFAALAKDEDAAVRSFVEMFANLPNDAVLAYAEPTLHAATLDALTDSLRADALANTSSGIAFGNIDVAVSNALLPDQEDVSELDFSGFKLDYPLDMLRASFSGGYDMRRNTGNVKLTDCKVRLVTGGTPKAKKVPDFDFTLLNLSPTMMLQFLDINFGESEFTYYQMWHEVGGPWSGDAFALVSDLDQLNELSFKSPQIMHIFKRHVEAVVDEDVSAATGDAAVLSDTVTFDAASAPEDDGQRDIWADADADMPVADDAETNPPVATDLSTLDAAPTNAVEAQGTTEA